MIHVSRITSKYQVTIPGDLRMKAHLEVGDKLMFRYCDNGDIIIHPLRKKTVQDVGGTLHRSDTPYVPIDEARRITQEELGVQLSGKEDDGE